MITQSIIINLIPSGISPRIKVSQYDTGAEAIEVTLLNGTEAYEIPADATVLLTGRTSGGQVFTKKATTASGSVATFGVIDAMTASAGTAKAEVEILDGQTVLGSANFDIYVEPSPVRKDNTAESDWSDLQAMANAVVAAGKKIDDAEQVVADATDAANKANEAITAIGDNVERSETAATSAEAAQTAAEAAQGKAESAQTAAETAEQSASASATTATTKATEAGTNASAAAESADAAKAWAVGPSDELTAGTDTDNAKYYAAQAKASADKAESVSAVSIATTSTVGIVKPDGDSITVDADGTIHGASKVPVATTEAVGTVKPDGDTITIDEDGTIHGVSKITVDDALSDTSENPVQNKAIKAAIDAQKETIGHLLILKITFSEEFKGKAYTVTGNGETFTGTVPNSLYINLYVHGLDSIYTVSAEYEGETYTSEVETKDFFGVYFGELTAWQATITVTVTDAVAGAVEGALVTATSTEKEYTQTTNAEGKAEIKVGKSGTYTIVAKNADGELTDTQEVVADTDKGTYIAEVSYWRATLTVTVTDKGVGVAGAKVTAASADKTYGPVATDAEGKVTIKIGKAGTYTVKAVNSEGKETNPQEKEITTAGETYTVTLTYEPEAVAWSDTSEGSEEKIKAMIEYARIDPTYKLSDYWAVGDERKVHLSAMPATNVSETHAEQDVTMVIMNFGGVPLADGSECLVVVGQKNGLTEGGYMNPSNTNSGSWGNCARRKWCNEVYFAALPTYLQNMFKKMITKTPLTATGSDWQSVEDMIALPSGAQVWATDAAAAATNSDGISELAKADFSGDIVQFEWYKTSANRIKKNGDSGDACYWWERSPTSRSGYSGQGFCMVKKDGGVYGFKASNVDPLAPFGCI